MYLFDYSAGIGLCQKQSGRLQVLSTNGVSGAKGVLPANLAVDKGRGTKISSGAFEGGPSLGMHVSM